MTASYLPAYPSLRSEQVRVLGFRWDGYHWFGKSQEIWKEESEEGRILREYNAIESRAHIFPQQTDL